MPTEQENVLFLYQVLTNDGPPIDWDAVAAELGLEKGAATKRWSRLKKAMDDGANPSPTSYALLWLCIKHRTHNTPMNWAAIARTCHTTPGAASKRYSRMKQVMEAGAAVPGAAIPDDEAASAAVNTAAPEPTTTPKATPKKKARKVIADSSSEDDGGSPAIKRMAAHKRKRAALKKQHDHRAIAQQQRAAAAEGATPGMDSPIPSIEDQQPAAAQRPAAALRPSGVPIPPMFPPPSYYAEFDLQFPRGRDPTGEERKSALRAELQVRIQEIRTYTEERQDLLYDLYDLDGYDSFS